MNNVIVATWFDDRIYRIRESGVIHDIASVSTKIGIEEKPFLLKWYADLGWDKARKQLYEAGEKGKRIHFAMWVYNQGGVVLYNPWRAPIYTDEQIEDVKKKTNGLFMVLKEQDEMVAIWKLQRFFDAVKPRILHSEYTVYSIEDDIAGTLDMALHIEAGTYDVNGSKKLIIPKSGIVIADLKSGNTVGDSVWEQISPYTVAFEKMQKVKVVGGLVLHTAATTRTGIEGFSATFRDRTELAASFEIYKNLAFVWNKRNPNFGPKAFDFPTFIQKKEFLNEAA